MTYQKKPSPKGGVVKRFLYLAALSVVATLAFSSVAMAQYITGPPEGPNGECSGVTEQLESELPGGAELFFLPDVGGCIDVGGSGAFGPLVNSLHYAVYDLDTGEFLGVAKDLDPDLSSGANSVTYQEFCGDFDESPYYTPQEYFDQEANAKEQEILDPNGDGLACTPEDAAFLAGDTPTEQPGDQYGQKPAEQPQQDGQMQPQQQMQSLPDTGGPALLLPVAGLLTGSGFLGLFVAIRRRA